jgi:hypothetical protein
MPEEGSVITGLRVGGGGGAEPTIQGATDERKCLKVKNKTFRATTGYHGMKTYFRWLKTYFTDTDQSDWNIICTDTNGYLMYKCTHLVCTGGASWRRNWTMTPTFQIAKFCLLRIPSTGGPAVDFP